MVITALPPLKTSGETCLDATFWNIGLKRYFVFRQNGYFKAKNLGRTDNFGYNIFGIMDIIFEGRNYAIIQEKSI